MHRLEQLTPTRRRILTALPVIVILAIGISSAAAIHHLRAARTATAHSRLTLIAAGVVQADVSEAENGQRAYLLTGDPSELLPYERAVRRVNTDLDALERLSSDNAAEHAVALRLRALVARKVAEIGERVMLQRQGRASAARALETSEDGLAAREAIRTVAADIQRGEGRELQASLQAEAADATRVYIVLALGVLAGAILVLLLHRTLVAAVAANAAAAAKIRSDNEQLALQAAAVEELNAALMEHQAGEAEARRVAEEARRRSDEVLSSISDVFFSIDGERRLTYLNKQAAALFRWDANEVLGQSLCELLPPVLHGEIHTAVNTVLITREVARFEHFSPRYGRFYTAAVYPAESGASIILTDVTVTRAAEQQFRAMTEAMPQIIWSALPDGEIDYINDAWFEYTGVTRGPGAYETWPGPIHLDDAQRLTNVWVEAVRTGKAFEVLYRLQNGRTGEYRWFLARGRSVLAPNGEVLRWFGACTDVHDERVNASRISALYEFAEAMSRTTTTDEVAKVAGEWGLRALGASACLVALMSKDGDMLDTVASSGHNAEFAHRYAQVPLSAPAACAAVARTGEPIAIESHEQRILLFPHIHATPNVRSLYATPLRSEGRVIGAWSIGFPDDRTFSGEEHQLFESLSALCGQAFARAAHYEAEREARQQAERANEAKTKFLRVMSHDLRTPLNAIVGYTELIQGGYVGPLVEKQAEFVERIRQSTNMLRTMIEEVLEYARIEAGKLNLTPAVLPVNVLLEQAESLVAPAAHASGITVLRAVVDPAVFVRGDQQRIGQILGNLVTNAQKFTQPGGTVMLGADRRDGAVEITVTDEGRGIAPEDLEAIFNPFVQAHRPPELGTGCGVGLGLAISRELARAMGGDVRADSVLGKGSVFRLILPAVEQGEPPLRLTA